MEVSLNPSLLTQLPELKIGIINYTKIVVAESPQMIKGRLQLYQENLYLEMQDQPVTEREGIAEWRQLWKQLGADPNRYRHSAESLMRRVSKQNYLTPLHSGVDLNNFFSLQYEIPVGIYDIAHLKGNIEIALGNEETGYEGLNGRFNTLNHILFSRDEEGPFGSPFVDSQRTAVSEATTEALHIFYLRPSLATVDAQKLLASAGKMFNQIHGGDYQIALLTNATPSTTL
ncbi:tRNA synthetase subunit beta [Lysinibacillus sphaericus]|uniref:B3/B4 domain-containing protein n=1 Tax=Lysinibacillus TaxID=400634 RepID=UPI00084A6397|nr:phenylalanine--tRNA ligase beta subunit-related protein [Lysinibacillus sphaericus]OEB99912.1 tRNA synthetase subunit beta [Lysinibacillus sphaericus]